MSSFGGNNLAFGLSINARDNTAAARQSALRGFMGMASKAVTIPVKFGLNTAAALRDINLGLAPVLRKAGELIERGARLNDEFASFSSLTGRQGDSAKHLVRFLQSASQMTLRYGESMRIANKALSDGFSPQQIGTILDFAARKARSVGLETQDVAESLVSAFGVGNTRALKQFGIDIEFVSQQFERMNGEGSFEQLDFAQRRAIILTAALGKMREEIGKLGVDGKSAGFGLAALTTSIGDASDRFFAALTRSESLKHSLRGLADTISGVTEHLEAGGSIMEVLFGKSIGEGDKKITSGGIFGLIKAGLMDAGEALGIGMLRGALWAINQIPDLFAAGGIVDKITQGGSDIDDILKTLGPEMPQGKQWLLGGGRRFDEGGRIQNLTQTFGTAVDVRGTGKQDVAAEFIEQKRRQVHELLGTIRQVGILPLLGITDVAATSLTGRANTQPVPGLWNAAGQGLDTAAKAIERGFLRAWRIITGSPDPGPINLHSRGGFGALNPMLAIAQGVGTAAMGGFWDLPTAKDKGFFDYTRALHAHLGSMETGGRLEAEMGRFRQVFEPTRLSESAMSRMGINPADYALSRRGRMLLKREQDNALRDMHRIDRGDFGIRQQAGKDTNAAVRELRMKGHSVSIGERRRMFQERFEQLKKEAKDPLRQRARDIDGEITGDNLAREVRRRAARGGVDFEEAGRIRKGVRDEYEQQGDDFGGKSPADAKANNAMLAEIRRSFDKSASTLDEIKTILSGYASALGIAAAGLPNGNA